MKIKAIKDNKYDNIYDIYREYRWFGWRYKFFVAANSIERAKEKANLRLKPASLEWEV